ncbi:uncharacterized protein FOMMEDRAFT_94494 [Fomitiporia mediterranea MF3/22]|uniref:uncharacterized protein n=1 Tax=Fomitiporia mediterranea (strain MF3/22) TaxID=694068 RepID=UPI000440749C|nr:uncharacterized protein FOMMEDRAFT_94494 [Fomitiporia mediterranea MF3/22]EJC99222.1 hypothetical protein FOMMEDRAFT_94494 [Fomitiporia mediterranea MF3/22]
MIFRLKLKCDRVFPCQSCVKRGCEGICPEGSLVSGRGSRYILANTEQLHEKIIQLTDRIRELEDALRVTCEEHARCLNPKLPPLDPPHPLLREDLLLIKNQLELYGLDRSQLGSRSSDSQYFSDGSDLDPRLGGDQHQPYSPLEMPYPNSAQQLMEPAHARHVRGHVSFLIALS